MSKWVMYILGAVVAFFLLKTVHAADWIVGALLLVVLVRWWFLRRHPGFRRKKNGNR
jgi:hypothetical protein